jgi:hypothetical protein
MCCFNLSNNSITLKPIVKGIVREQQTTILLIFILVENDEVGIAVIGEIDGYEVIKLKAWIPSIDVCYDKRNGVLIHLYCELDM